MRVIRLPATGIVAASIVALGLAGCPSNVDPPPTPASKKPRASASPTPKPIATLTPAPTPPVTTSTPGGPTATPATTTPTATPSGGATATPTPIGPPPSGKTLTVTGLVRDDAGTPIANAKVTGLSLDGRAAFTATVDANADGKFTLPNVPEGVNVELTATKAGYTTRKRVAAYIAGRAAETDFGASSGASNDGAAYFLAAKLEIDRIEPDAALLAKGQLGFTVVFSEPLDATNQVRAVQALRVWPASDGAAPRGDGNSTDDEDLSKKQDTGAALAEPVIESDTDSGGYVVDYVVKDLSPFLAGDVDAAARWSADGTRMTFDLPAPLLRSKSGEVRYQIGFVRGADSGTKIESTANHALGTDRFGAIGALPTFAGNLLRNTFRAEVPTLNDDDGNGTISAAERWTSTHDTTRAFSLPRDNTAPKLLAVRTEKDVAGSFRFVLQFDEAMVAYNAMRDGEATKALDGDDDRDGDVDLADFIRAYTFVLADATGGTASVDMDGFKGSSSDISVDPRGAAFFGGDSGTRGRELAFDVGAVAFRKRLDEATTGQVIVSADEIDPRLVYLTIKGRPNWLDPAVKEVKVRVGAVADPAGNGIGTTQANRDVRTVAP